MIKFASMMQFIDTHFGTISQIGLVPSLDAKSGFSYFEFAADQKSE